MGMEAFEIQFSVIQVRKYTLGLKVPYSGPQGTSVGEQEDKSEPSTAYFF